MTEIGIRIPLIDALEKVTGSLKYGSGFKLPGMHYGKVLRSRLLHARIVSIDATRARRLSGVKAVAMGLEEQLPIYPIKGERYPDERLLDVEEVRYIGDEVAAAAAIDLEAAAEALKRIRVEYEKLSAVMDPAETMKEGAPQVHLNVERNIARTIQIRHGDVDSAFWESDAVVEGTFKTPFVQQACREPHTTVAQWDSHGKVTLWIPTRSPTLARMTYANALGGSRDKIRIIQMPMGGTFGGKLEYKLHPLCVLLARKANAPVKMTDTREEEFAASLPRVPMILKMKAGCRKDGTLLGKHAEIIADNGADLNYRPGIRLSATIRHDNFYRPRHVRTDSYLVYTNEVPTGCFREFGCIQSFFAFESLIDMLAHEIQMDRAEFRLKNASQTGDLTPHRWILGSCGLSEVITKSMEKADWHHKRVSLPTKGSPDAAYGIEIACSLHISGNRSFFSPFSTVPPQRCGSTKKARCWLMWENPISAMDPKRLSHS